MKSNGSHGRGARLRSRVPSIFAGVFAVAAVLCALGAFSWGRRGPVNWLRHMVDLFVISAPPNLAYAAFLAVLAAAVAQRKRIALWFVVAFLGLHLLALAAFFLLLPFPDFDPPGRLIAIVGVNTAILIGAFALLFWARREFCARVQRASLRKALLVFISVAAAGIVVGYGLVTLFPGSLVTRDDRFSWAVEKVLGGAFVVDFNRSGRPPHGVSLVLGLLGAIALFAALITLFRTQRSAAGLPPADEQRIRGLLAADGERDSLGYFATRRDKQAVFSPTGKAAVTYRVVAGVALASGDPIGDPEAWPQAIEAWLARAREFAWTPAVMGASETGATAYSRAGMRVLQLGDEAIVTVRAFTLDGREMRPVRQAVHRVERAGYTARIRRHADIPPEEMARIVQLAAEWRDTETERGFSMALSRLGDPTDGQCVLVEAMYPDGREAAVLSFTPWGRHGLSLDLMRRDRNADNGLMEFLVTMLVRQAPMLGVERISLNFAVFRSAFEEGARIGAGPVLRAWRSLLLFFSRWWQIESLYRSNAKYRPEWVPRFLCYRERRELARIGIASAVAEGFLSAPSLTKLFSRGRARAAELPTAPPPELVALMASDQAQPEPEAQPRQDQLPEQVRVRMGKVERMRYAGIDPYPVSFERTDTCAAVRYRHDGLAADTATGDRVAVAGRVMLLRNHGGLCFATIRDWSGDMQIMLSADQIGQDRLATWKSTVDLGDHVGAIGEVVSSKRGELSVLAETWTLTAKCLRPLPEKRHGLADPEARVRQRYLDLAVNPEARRVLRARSEAIRSVRESLNRRGYLEVETPMLQRIHGGANARPFVTHINAYDMRLYLRIAPELYLKRLCVGGVDKVFELGRNFRNEGADATHNPEFTMLEAYQAYADYDVMLRLVREMIQEAALAANGSTLVQRQGVDGSVEEHDIGGEWRVTTVNDAISEAVGVAVTADTTREELQKLAEDASIPYNPDWGRGAMVAELYDHLVEARTVLPTFYKDFPTEVSPLTREHRSDPRLAERWDLVAFGAEIGTAYSELVDPIEQRRRLTEQSLLAAGGDPEAMELDEDFLQALEYAMPPSGGLGMGVDRLVMMLTGRNIRETLPFPLVRPGGR